jgi:light-regulated signal transduction histidine kinase (bacteriophytochrome)
MNNIQSIAGPADIQATVSLLQEELQATNQEVMMLTLDLEQRVAERTAELSQAIRELRREVAERLRAEQQVKHLNEDLKQRAELLESANEELEAFCASVSHDLRNPLARIVGYADLLQESGRTRLDEKERSFLKKISSTGLEMGALIEDLLRLARASQAELNCASVDLNQLVDTLLSELEHLTQGRNIVWKLDRLPVVYGDGALLKQALVNLITNAMKYSKTRNPSEIEIVSIAKNAEEWVIAVRDNGVGFDPEKARKLFGAFQRMHDSKDFQGTGIGLANVRRIILRHGGRVWAESKPECGASFYFSLPVKIRP